MTVIYLVLPLAIILAAAAVGAFIWSVRRGQYDDVDTPAIRMLHGDEPIDPPRTRSADEPEGP